jgi:RNA polymerase sigma-70 factor (ECF subfamily)
MALEKPVMPSVEEEPPLLPRIARGEAGAVNDCVRRYGPLVWSWARRMSPSRADAEDAVQEIFMQLWKSAATFDANRCSERGFVAMVARRRLIDRLRSQRARRGLEVALSPADFDADTASWLQNDPDAQRAAQLIAALPEDRRNVVLLFLAYGCSHSEISERTGMPLGTVKSVVRRSLMLIRAQLGLRVDGGLREEPAR